MPPALKSSRVGLQPTVLRRKGNNPRLAIDGLPQFRLDGGIFFLQAAPKRHHQITDLPFFHDPFSPLGDPPFNTTLPSIRFLIRSAFNARIGSPMLSRSSIAKSST